MAKYGHSNTILISDEMKGDKLVHNSNTDNLHETIEHLGKECRKKKTFRENNIKN